MTQTISTGGYVRHRDRMVQESVVEDLQNTLIACRWMSGTTTRRVIDPNNPALGWTTVTTDPSQVLKIVGKRAEGSTELAEVVLIDYFPEAGRNDDESGESRKTEWNTLAIDKGVAQEPMMVELGSNMQEQPYIFTMAFYAASDAVALAMMNDLRDRYAGRLVTDDHINLYNYNDPEFDPVTSPPVCRMEVEYFTFQQDAQTVTPWDVHLYFAELRIVDIVDPSYAVSPRVIEQPPVDPEPEEPGPGEQPEALVFGHGPPPDDLVAINYVDMDTGDLYGSDVDVDVEIFVGETAPGDQDSSENHPWLAQDTEDVYQWSEGD